MHENACGRKAMLRQGLRLRRRFPTLALAALIVSLPATAGAQMICTEPLMPFCAKDLSTIASEQQEALCLEDMARYEDQLDEYVTCVRETADVAEQRLAASSELRQCLEESEPADCEPLE